MLTYHDILVGEAKIARLYDSSLNGETAQSLFPMFAREEVRPHERWLCPTHFNADSGHVPLPVQTFVIEARGKIILIDTCIGNDKDRPLVADMHMLTTRYLDRLAELGLQPEDVDYVMCTHLHPDHVGWNTQLIDERWVPTFPNARYVISRTEYENQKRDAATTSFSAARNTFNDSIQPIVSAGMVEFVDGVHELLDDFTFRPAPGHTVGHVRIELRSCGDSAVFAGDVLHSPLQIPLWHWSSKYCADHELAKQSRRELLEFCVSENALLIPGHFEAPYFARVKEVDGIFLPDFGW